VAGSVAQGAEARWRMVPRPSASCGPG